MAQTTRGQAIDSAIQVAASSRAPAQGESASLGVQGTSLIGAAERRLNRPGDSINRCSATPKQFYA